MYLHKKVLACLACVGPWLSLPVPSSPKGAAVKMKKDAISKYTLDLNKAS